MKFLALILVFAISLPPLQAGYCDMVVGHDGLHQVIKHEHGKSTGHKCCDREQSDPKDNCGNDSICGLCSASVPAIPVIFNVRAVAVHAPAMNLPAGAIIPAHSPPLYRPPIS